MITNFLIFFKKSPLLALLNSKRIEISPKNGWRARVAGEPRLSFPNWRKGWDSNPHTPCGVPVFETGALPFGTPFHVFNVGARPAHSILRCYSGLTLSLWFGHAHHLELVEMAEWVNHSGTPPPCTESLSFLKSILN